MTTVRRFLSKLSGRETLQIELPAFLVRALEQRVKMANTSGLGEELTLNNLIEIELAETVSIIDVAQMEREMPGIQAAVSNWLSEIE